jgi:hypothetical protein
MLYALEIPMYHTHVYVCDSYKEQPYPDIDEDDGTPTACVWHKKGAVYMTYKPEEMNLGVLAHECLHIAHHIFEMRGIVADVTHDEHTAYLMEFVFDDLVKVLRLGGTKND